MSQKTKTPKTVKSNQNVAQEPMLILKGQEIHEFEALLDTLPHGYAKQIISFINSVQQKRQMEAIAAQQSNAMPPVTNEQPS